MKYDVSKFDILSAKYLNGYRIELLFKNGKSGVVDFLKYIDSMPIYRVLHDINKFKSFSIINGYLIWEHEGIDIAPETLYHEATGEPYPEWLESMTSIVAEPKI